MGIGLKREAYITNAVRLQGQWLRLDSQNPISIEVKKPERCATDQDVLAQETVIRKMIYAAYNLA